MDHLPLAIDRPQVVGRYSIVDIEPDRMPGHIDNDAVAAVSMRICSAMVRGSTRRT
jgi:hypothetical protein